MQFSRFVWPAFVIVAAGCMAAAAAQTAPRDAAAAAVAAPQTEAPKAMDFPRTLSLANGAFTVYEPQIEDHAAFTVATAKSAASYRSARGVTSFGVIRYRAKMVVDQANRLVTFYDREILEILFPGLSETETETLIADIRANILTRPEAIPLDVVLGYVAGDAKSHKAVEISLDPPKIFYATQKTLLVALDGDPIKVAVEGSGGLSVIVNTNWDLFHSEDTGAYWLLLGDAWLTASTLDGTWRVATAPEGISALPDNDRWKRVKAAVPGGSLSPPGAPIILVAQAPAELIVTNGEAQLEPIPGAQLSFVANTSSDIVYNAADRFYYFLTSGRWFKASSLNGKWVGVKAAPPAFQAIPAGHPRAHVRASVAGTPEAELAIVQAEIPKTAEVSRKTAAPTVQYAGGEARFEKIHGVDVYRATNTTFNVLRVNGRYYLCHDAIWFVSEKPGGLWTIADTVPGVIYDIPASSPAHHVTYVRIYESKPNVVYVGYTPGYHYSYVSNGVVVYGSGYYWGTYYNPSYYSHYASYYYQPYPATYGQASIYQTNTGTYAHGHYAYGPNGGYWAGNRYNPNTGRYGGGVYAYDYDSAAYEGRSYNPRNGVSTSTSQGIQWSDADSYETWGETVVQRDDNWVQAERYGTEDGYKRQVQTSEGAQAAQVGTTDNRVTVGQTADGDVYAGANGNVYRRSEDGQWETRSDGEWTTVDTEGAKTSASSRASDAGVDTSTLSQNAQTANTQTARSNASSRASDAGFDTSTLSQNEQFTSRQRQQQSSFDPQSLERDRTARTSGRSQYESFRSGAGARSGNRGGQFSGGGRPALRQ